MASVVDNEKRSSIIVLIDKIRKEPIDLRLSALSTVNDFNFIGVDVEVIDLLEDLSE